MGWKKDYRYAMDIFDNDNGCRVKFKRDDNLLLVEEKPHKFYLRGIRETITEKAVKKSVTIDGLEYSRIDKVSESGTENFNEIDYDSLDWHKWNSGSSNLYEARNTGVKLYKHIIDFLPYFCVEIFFDNTSIRGLDYDFKDIRGKKWLFNEYSEATDINALWNILNVCGIDAESRRHSYTDWDISSMGKFLYPYQNYGYGNTLYYWVRFDDILNMDVSMFKDSNELDLFRIRCGWHKTIKQALNFDVFKRPLTDIEKLDCARNFIQIWSDTVKKGKDIDGYL
jgi:hypothetical protein